MRLQKLRKQWSEIPLERKLAMFVAPLFVALAAGILIPMMSGALDGNGGESQSPAAQPGRLEVVDLEVARGEDAEAIGDPEATQLIDVTLRNASDVISVIKGANLRIRDFALLKICEAGGGLTPSVAYDVMLPPSPSAGELVEVDISQQVPSNSADRFTIRMNVPPSTWGDGRRLYRLDVELLHDTATRPLQAGTAIVSVPHLPTRDYFPASIANPASYAPDILACYEQKEETLRSFLKLEGKRSPGLTEQLLE
jgi:hypothetical protein